MLTSFSFKIFFILLREHLLSPATKHNKKEFFVLKNKLLTIEPTSVLRLFAASCAVRAELSKTITLKLLSKCFSFWLTLFTGSLFNKSSI